MDRVHDEIDAARDGAVTGAAVQALQGQMDGRQRGGTGRVHGDAGALEIEEIGDAIGDRPVPGIGPVGAVHDAHKHADAPVGAPDRRAALTQRGRCVSRILDGGVGLLDE